jgi:hypothetical protein
MHSRGVARAAAGIRAPPSVMAGGISWNIRRGQVKGGSADFVDKRLPSGNVVVPGGRDWTLVATITGTAGIHLGSYAAIASGQRRAFSVLDIDVRTLMVRQIWGARVLQSGAMLPDSNDRDVYVSAVSGRPELPRAANPVRHPGKSSASGRNASVEVFDSHSFGVFPNDFDPSVPSPTRSRVS